MNPEITANPSPTRGFFVAVAIEEFLAIGFGGTSMDRIAEVATVSKKTIYGHFRGKEELFQAIGDTVIERVREMELRTDRKWSPVNRSPHRSHRKLPSRRPCRCS